MYLLCFLHKVQMLSSDNLRLGVFPSRLLPYWTYYSDGTVTLFIWYQNALFIRTVDLGKLNDKLTNQQTVKRPSISIYPRLLTRLNYCPSTFDLLVNPFKGLQQVTWFKIT